MGCDLDALPVSIGGERLLPRTERLLAAVTRRSLTASFGIFPDYWRSRACCWAVRWRESIDEGISGTSLNLACMGVYRLVYLYSLDVRLEV